MPAQPKPFHLEKPRFGEPCNGCSYCCVTQPCRLAEEFLQCTEGPCVALEQEGGRGYCGLVRRPIHYILGKDVAPSVTGELQVAFASALGLGLGCDSDDGLEDGSEVQKIA